MTYTATIETFLGAETISVTDAQIDALPGNSLAQMLRDNARVNDFGPSASRIAAEYFRETV